MRKRELRQLALLGLSSGLLLANQLSAQDAKKPPTTAAKEETKSTSKDTSKESSADSEDANDGNLNYHVMTEGELMLELNSRGKTMYDSLDGNGKALALLVASMMCNGTNPCAGLNSCQTDKHDCAGKGDCKNTGKCATSDKNLAVKLVYDKMAKKRANAAKPS